MSSRGLARASLAVVVLASAAVLSQLPVAAGATPHDYPSASAVGSATATPQPGGSCPHDRDCDGMPNDWERQHGLDPRRNDSRGDPDHDHLANLLEYLDNGDPQDPDTDSDGLHDGREVHFFHTRVDRADAIVGNAVGTDQCRTGSTGAYPCPVVTLFDATIVLQDSDGMEVARTTTDFAGRFNFLSSVAPPGDYKLTAQPLLGFAQPPVMDIHIAHDQRRALSAGQSYANDAGAGVAGQTTESPTCGGPQRRDEGCIAVVAGAHIDVEDTHGKVVASTTSDADGRYVIALDPGTYSVVARAPDGSYPAPPAPVEITVGSDDAGPNHLDLDYSTGIL